MDAVEIKKVACVGCGLMGFSWAVNFALRGLEVNAHEVSEEALETARTRVLGTLQRLLQKGVITGEALGQAAARITFTTDLGKAVADVQFIQESGPENYEIKRGILEEIEKCASPSTIFASSTSGLLITEIAKNAKHPERCLGAHPYNPPHLIPLVEISRGEMTSPETIETAVGFYRLIGKEPIVLQKEALGFIANRLQIALYREAMDLVRRGVCSVEDVDKATTYGLGLRWAIMGPNLTFQLGGGAYGIKGLIHHLGPSVNMWLKDMADWKDVPGDWADMAQAGVNAAMANRPPGQGQNSQELALYMEEMLLGILKLHGKI